MKPTVRFPEDLMSKVQGHLFGGGPGRLDEACAFAYATLVDDGDQPILLVQGVFMVEEDGFEYVAEDGFSLRQEVKVDAVLRARRTNTRLIEIHSHPHPKCDDFVRFSLVDEHGQREWQRYLGWKHPGPWAALVFGRNCASGTYWQPGDSEPTTVARLTVGGRDFPLSDSPPVPIDEERFDRQLRAYGVDGQRRLKGCRVVLVGCGGLGSFLALQLVLLGVEDFLLIDDDHVSNTNLNRLPIANQGEVGRLKVDVTAEAILRIQPEARVERVAASLRTIEAMEAIRRRDVIIAGVDNDGARMVLTHIAAAYLIPYIDVASDIIPAGKFVASGGRVHVWRPRDNCLACDGLLDDEEVRNVLSTTEELEVRRSLGYGGEKGPPSPSVGHINAHVAASAVDEFHALVAGAHRLHRHRRYRADRGVENVIPTPKRVRYCPCCTESLGVGDAVHLKRFVAKSSNSA